MTASLTAQASHASPWSRQPAGFAAQSAWAAASKVPITSSWRLATAMKINRVKGSTMSVVAKAAPMSPPTTERRRSVRLRSSLGASALTRGLHV